MKTLHKRLQLQVAQGGLEWHPAWRRWALGVLAGGQWDEGREKALMAVLESAAIADLHNRPASPPDPDKTGRERLGELIELAAHCS